jgi:hypothetical protein
MLERSKVSAMAPREGTKMAAIVGLLERDHGATLPELIRATDWLPHTVRAALTGLRKRGFVVTLDRTSKERGSAYAIARDQIVSEIAEPQTNEPAVADQTRKPNSTAKSERTALATSGSAA